MSGKFKLNLPVHSGVADVPKAKPPVLNINLPMRPQEPASSSAAPAEKAKPDAAAASVQKLLVKGIAGGQPTFCVDILTAALTLPASDRTPAKIANVLKERYGLQGDYQVDVFLMSKVEADKPIPENSRVGCLIHGSNTSYLEYLVEQNRQLTANLEGSQDALVALSSEVDKLRKKLDAAERREREHLKAPGSEGGSRKSSKKDKKKLEPRCLDSPLLGSPMVGSPVVGSSATTSTTSSPAMPSTSSSHAMGPSGSEPLHSTITTTVTTTTVITNSPGPVPYAKSSTGSHLVSQAPVTPQPSSGSHLASQAQAPVTSQAPASGSHLVAQSPVVSPSPASSVVSSKPAGASVLSPRNTASPRNQLTATGLPVLNLEQRLAKRTSGPYSQRDYNRGSVTPTKTGGPQTGREGNAECLTPREPKGPCRLCPPGSCGAYQPKEGGLTWMCTCGHLSVKHAVLP
jgi:hypothetical protein